MTVGDNLYDQARKFEERGEYVAAAEHYKLALESYRMCDNRAGIIMAKVRHNTCRDAAKGD